MCDPIESYSAKRDPRELFRVDRSNARTDDFGRGLARIAHNRQKSTCMVNCTARGCSTAVYVPKSVLLTL